MRLARTFTASTPKGKRTAKGRGIIDTAAEITLIDDRTACAVGTIKRDNPVAVGGVGAGRMVGYEFWVSLRIGKRHARVKAVVPFANVVARADNTVQLAPLRNTRNLIGIDFLRKTAAVIDFGRRSNFGDGEWPFDIALSKKKITPAEVAALRKLPLCKSSKHK